MVVHAGSVGTDREALETLFAVTNGREWTNKQGWCSNQDLATWYGVTVTNDGRVQHLNLGNNNLTGRAPVVAPDLIPSRAIPRHAVAQLFCVFHPGFLAEYFVGILLNVYLLNPLCDARFMKPLRSVKLRYELPRNRIELGILNPWTDSGIH